MSSVSRRDFFTRLFGAALVVPFLAKIDARALSPAVNPVVADLAEPLPAEWRRGVLQEAWRIFRDQMSKRGITITPDQISPASKLGQSLFQSVLTHQGSVDFTWFAEQPMTSAGHLTPAMAALADYCVSHELGVWGSLDLPEGIEGGRIGCLRMVRQYDPFEQREYVRFDVIGGPTEAVMKRRERDRVTAIKTRIRGRLGRAKPILLP